ncbi:MAG: creatininase family protein [Planctomycetota bacterium]|nr:creatininase family protein [Planctomycetota bacterium]
MLWEELTADEFAGAVDDCEGVCIITLGVLERHLHHLPPGTDLMLGQHVAELAARREPVVVFPPWYLGEVYEAVCFPGTVTLPPKSMVELMLAIFDEIGRNGFTKIITFLSHGGNVYLAPFLAQCQLFRQKSYQVYSLFWDQGLTEAQRAKWNAVMETDGGQHAGESETSIMMAHRPDLVKMEALDGQVAEPLGRLDHVKPGYTALWWYADYPEHYAGDARTASAEKGKVLTDLLVDSLAAFIRAVKNDTVTPKLAWEFFSARGRIAKRAEIRPMKKTHRAA